MRVSFTHNISSADMHQFLRESTEFLERDMSTESSPKCTSKSPSKAKADLESVSKPPRHGKE